MATNSLSFERIAKWSPYYRFHTFVLSCMVSNGILFSTSHRLIVSAEHDTIHFPSDESEQALTLET